MADEPSTCTAKTFSYGIPTVEVDLKGTGTAVTNTLYLDGGSFLEIQVAP